MIVFLISLLCAIPVQPGQELIEAVDLHDIQHMRNEELVELDEKFFNWFGQHLNNFGGWISDNVAKATGQKTRAEKDKEHREWLAWKEAKEKKEAAEKAEEEKKK